MDFNSAPEFFLIFFIGGGIFLLAFFIIITAIVAAISGRNQMSDPRRGLNGFAYDPLNDPANPMSPLNPSNPASLLYPHNPPSDFSANLPISTDAGMTGSPGAMPATDAGGTWSGGTGFDTGGSMPSSDPGGTWSGGGGFDSGASSPPSSNP